MVRGGFRKEEAGAIEVLSANGSQLIPPIMGLGAFLMAVITGIPYVEIAKAAILPALLYVATLVIGVFMAIHHFTDIGYQMWADALSGALLEQYARWRAGQGLPPSRPVAPPPAKPTNALLPGPVAP